MRVSRFACLFLLLAVVTVAGAGSLVTYDSFDGSFIRRNGLCSPHAVPTPMIVCESSETKGCAWVCARTR